MVAPGIRRSRAEVAWPDAVSFEFPTVAAFVWHVAARPFVVLKLSRDTLAHDKSLFLRQ